MFCNHKYGKIEDGYQYCKKCGRAIVAPRIPCDHRWKQIERANFEITNGFGGISKKGILFLYKCEKCGETKTVKFEV